MSPYRTPLSLFTLLSLVPLALAHIQLVDPYPILSPMNPAVPWDEKNYNMMAPLTWEGDNLPYPCKGYLSSTSEEDRISQKSWPAGSTQTLSFGTGGAPHLGGSCQVVLSYDNGATWQVIYSYIGGCMIESWSWSFPIPSEAPSGEAILGWNWFNNQGNREMYQNCAVVTITEGGEGLPEGDDYPPPFVANAKVNECSTVEGQDPVFPRPGKNVHWSGKYKDGWRPENGYGTTGSGCEDDGGGRPPAGANGLVQGQQAGPRPTSASSSEGLPSSTRAVDESTSSATANSTSEVPPGSTSIADELSSTAALTSTVETGDPSFTDAAKTASGSIASTESAQPTSDSATVEHSTMPFGTPSASMSHSLPGDGHGHIAFPPPSGTASAASAEYTPPPILSSPTSSLSESPSAQPSLSADNGETAAGTTRTEGVPSETILTASTATSQVATSASVTPTSTDAYHPSRTESISTTESQTTDSASSGSLLSSASTFPSPSLPASRAPVFSSRPTSCAATMRRRRLQAGLVKVKRDKAWSIR